MSASVMRSTAPPFRRAGHVGSLSGLAGRITDLMTLLWSSGAAHPPGGTSREQLSKVPNSNSSVDTWVDEVRSKGKGTRCPSCGECAKDCSCRRQISSLEDRVKELKRAAKEKKRDDDSKWKEMEQKLEQLTNLVQNLSTTGLTGPAPIMASHPAPTSSAAPASTP